MAEWFKAVGAIQMFKLVSNNYQPFCSAFSTPPFTGRSGPRRGLEHAIEGAKCLSVPHPVSRRHNQVIKCLMVCAVLGIRLRSWRKLVTLQSKAHSMSASIQGDSSQAMALGACHQGNPPVGSEAHAEDLAEHLPWNPGPWKIHVMLLWSRTPSVDYFSASGLHFLSYCSHAHLLRSAWLVTDSLKGRGFIALFAQVHITYLPPSCPGTSLTWRWEQSCNPLALCACNWEHGK